MSGFNNTPRNPAYEIKRLKKQIRKLTKQRDALAGYIRLKRERRRP